MSARRAQRGLGYAIGALPEILDGSDTLGATPEEAASIIVDLLGDPPRMQGIGRRNRERARSMFDVRTMIASYAQLYDQVLKQASSRAVIAETYLTPIALDTAGAPGSAD